MYKVLFINCADYGSTGTIIMNIAKELHETGNSAVLCVPTRHEKKDYYKTYSLSIYGSRYINRKVAMMTGMVFGFAPLSTLRLLLILKKEKPDIVHLHCPNGYMINLYWLISWLNRNSIPTVLTNHCEMFYTANCAHSFDCLKWKTGCGDCPNLRREGGVLKVDRTDKSWKIFKDAFSNYKQLAVVSVSDWVKERSASSPILGNYKNYVIGNGVDTDVFFNRRKSMEDIRDKYGINPKNKIVLFVTAGFSEEKGRSLFLRITDHYDENITFLLIGDDRIDCELSSNTINIGRINDAELLSKMYSVSDVTMVLSKKETFSMVTAESLCCGTPVVGFLAGGPESIGIPKYSRFCKNGDVDQLIEHLNYFMQVNYSDEEIENCSRIAREKFSIKEMKSAYLELYNSMLLF